MPSFKINAFGTPFGRNVFLFSTRGLKHKGYTVASETIPARIIDGHPGQKVLQPGTVMAKITSGPHTGKIGPFQAAGSAAAEVQRITPTTVTAGTFKVKLFPGVAGEVETSALAFNATNATVETAVRAALALSSDVTVAEYADSVTVTGGPLNSGFLAVTYLNDSGADITPLSVDQTALTGTVAITTTTAGVVGALDGRGTLANIVGINDTFLPWQLIERDVECAVLYEAAVVQANCIELDAAGAEIVLTNTTATEMFAKKGMNITFHAASTEI